MSTAGRYIPVSCLQVTRYSDSSLAEQSHCFKASSILGQTVPIPLLALVQSNSPYTPSLSLYTSIINTRFKITAAAVPSQAFKDSKGFKGFKFKTKTRPKANTKIPKALKTSKKVKVVAMAPIKPYKITKRARRHMTRSRSRSTTSSSSS